MVNFSIIGITIDRLVAIKKPFMYQRLDYRFPMFTFVISFLLSAFLSLLHSFTNDDIGLIPMIVISIVVGSFLFSANFYIRKIVKRQHQEIKRLMVTSDVDQSKKNETESRKRELRATRLCLYIVYSYFIFILPCACELLMRLIFSNRYLGAIPAEVGMILLHLILWNGLTDCVLYVKSNSELKNVLR